MKNKTSNKKKDDSSEVCPVLGVRWVQCGGVTVCS